MSIDPSQLASLLSVISEENTTSQTLEALATSFHQFFNKQDFFKIGCAIVSLLQNKDLLVHPTQRLVCIYFLYDMYRSDQIILNPFVTIFNYLVSPPIVGPNGSAKELHWSLPRLSAQEKFFVSQLITSPPSNPPKEFFKKTALQIMQMDQASLNNIDVSGFQFQVVEKLTSLPHTSRAGIPCVLTDIEASRYGFEDLTPRNGSEQQKQCIEGLLIGPDAPFRKYMKPEFIRLAPPLHVAQDELIWLESDCYIPEFAWDNSILNSSNTTSKTSEIRKLIAKACRSQLNINQQQQLESAIGNDLSIFLHLDLTPEKFSNLVELNPSIAVKVILAYQESDSNELTPYLEKLLTMKMSVHSMEVVNNLARLVILPEEFIHLYISTCILKCETMTEDRQLQNRLVRLLCVFIQSLIVHRIIDPKDLQIELQPFCIEFSTIKEANQLYRSLKANNENSSNVNLSQQQQQQANANQKQGTSKKV